MKFKLSKTGNKIKVLRSKKINLDSLYKVLVISNQVTFNTGNNHSINEKDIETDWKSWLENYFSYRTYLKSTVTDIFLELHKELVETLVASILRSELESILGKDTLFNIFARSPKDNSRKILIHCEGFSCSFYIYSEGNTSPVEYFSTLKLIVMSTNEHATLEELRLHRLKCQQKATDIQNRIGGIIFTTGVV